MKKAPEKKPAPKARRTVHEGQAQSEQRADLLVKTLTEKSRSEIRAMFQLGCVSVNGKRCENPGEMLAVGDQIKVQFDPARRYREKAPAYKSRLFTVLFEDNYLIVVNKQAGFLTMPTEKEEAVSLITSVNKYISVKGGRQQGATLVHRLDRDTSGILVLAKHHNLAQTLKEQFASRKPMRKYVAIAKGRPKLKSGTYKSFLATDEDLNQYSTGTSAEGKLAITHFKVVKQYKDCCLLHVRLETGRRNQIRVHFAEHDHPILGDTRYKPGMAKHPRWTYRRIALHAAELGFTHPVTKKELSFSTPVPKEFDEFLSGAE